MIDVTAAVKRCSVGLRLTNKEIINYCSAYVQF